MNKHLGSFVHVNHTYFPEIPTSGMIFLDSVNSIKTESHAHLELHPILFGTPVLGLTSGPAYSFF